MNLLLGMEVNQGKRSIALDLHRAEGQAVINRLLPSCDVLIYNKLPEQARRLGVAPEQVHAINEQTVISAVTAYGGINPGGWEQRPAYDPVIQALSGIMHRYGGESAPAVHGIASCIDYFTGYAGAFGALLGLVARSKGDKKLVTRTSLVRTAGWVQLPQLCNPDEPTSTGLLSRGNGTLDRLYRVRGGWIHIAVAPRTAAYAVPNDFQSAHAWLARNIRRKCVEQAIHWAQAQGLVAQEVLSARVLRRRATQAMPRGSRMDPKQRSGRIVRVQHPAGETYFAPEASWLRFDKTPRRRIADAPTPGQHSVTILGEAGYSAETIDRFLADQVSAEKWPGLSSYIPA